MSEELDPCPFCEGEAKVISCGPTSFTDYESYAYVACRNCKSTGPVIFEPCKKEEVEEIAIEAWNTRAESTCKECGRHER